MMGLCDVMSCFLLQVLVAEGVAGVDEGEDVVDQEAEGEVVPHAADPCAWLLLSHGGSSGSVLPQYKGKRLGRAGEVGGDCVFPLNGKLVSQIFLNTFSGNCWLPYYFGV